MRYVCSMRIPPNARAIVTGAGSGFGRAVSLELARRGARVVVSDIDLESANDTADSIRASGGISRAMRVDVMNPDEVHSLVQCAVTEWDGVDVLVNNAGVVVGGRVGEVSLEDWGFELAVNLMGIVHGCHFTIPVMRRQRRGWILNVASAAGLLSVPLMAPYNVSKAGVVALTETLRTELKADRISTSVLCPTLFRSNICRSQRVPADLRAVSEELVTKSSWSAEDVVHVALRGLERGKLYVIPQLDGKVLWRAKRALGASFYAVLGFLAGRTLRRGAS
jgi:NAD(P)-dependent dehydrogenase (short-subunit alcohol dehydrogenase family)